MSVARRLISLGETCVVLIGRADDFPTHRGLAALRCTPARSRVGVAPGRASCPEWGCGVSRSSGVRWSFAPTGSCGARLHLVPAHAKRAQPWATLWAFGYPVACGDPNLLLGELVEKPGRFHQGWPELDQTWHEQWPAFERIGRISPDFGQTKAGFGQICPISIRVPPMSNTALSLQSWVISIEFGWPGFGQTYSTSAEICRPRVDHLSAISTEVGQVSAKLTSDSA